MFIGWNFPHREDTLDQFLIKDMAKSQNGIYKNIMLTTHMNSNICLSKNTSLAHFLPTSSVLVWIHQSINPSSNKIFT